MRTFRRRPRQRGVVQLIVMATAAMVLAAPAAPVQAATTTLVAQVSTASGGAVANAPVWVFEWPVDPSATSGSALLIGQGTTSASGSASVTLDTSSVPAGDIDPTGEFNVMVGSFDQASGKWALDTQAAVVGQSTSDTTVATGTTDAGTLAPTTTTPTLNYTSGSSCSSCAADVFRYVKVMVWNVGDGMKSVRSFTTGRATDTNVAVATGGATPVNWSVGGMFEEETARTLQVVDTRNGSHHFQDYAEYRMREYKATMCTRFGCFHQWQWHPHHFDGNYTCPDSSGCGANGIVCPCDAYTQPTFVAANATVLPAGRVITRHDGKTKTFSASFTLEGLSLGSKAQYTSNTEISWQRSSTSVCSQTPYLWGASRDYSTADIVQASCHA